MVSAGSRVLVADDDPLVRFIIVETLADAGFDVLEASTGDEACQMVEDHVGLIVTDLNMPGCDGMAVATWVRANHPDIPVLFVSARSDLLAPVAFPYRFLTKPFTMRQLAATVREMMSRDH